MHTGAKCVFWLNRVNIWAMWKAKYDCSRSPGCLAKCHLDSGVAMKMPLLVRHLMVDCLFPQKNSPVSDKDNNSAKWQLANWDIVMDPNTDLTTARIGLSIIGWQCCVLPPIGLPWYFHRHTCKCCSLYLVVNQPCILVSGCGCDLASPNSPMSNSMQGQDANLLHTGGTGVTSRLVMNQSYLRVFITRPVRHTVGWVLVRFLVGSIVES